MVSPDTALRRLLQETAKLLQRYHFDGTDPIWSRTEPTGVASIGRTRVTRTWTNGQQIRSFGLTLNVVPTPWWEYCNWRNTQQGLPPVPADAVPGPIDSGPHSRELTAPWILRTDPAGNGEHALPADIDTIRAELPRRIHGCARRALQLLEPDCYLDELSAQPNPRWQTRAAIVVLLAEQGPGPRFDEAVHRLQHHSAEGEAPGDPADIVTYARRRADRMAGQMTPCASIASAT